MQLTTDNVVRFDATSYLEQLWQQSNVFENRYHYSCSHPFILLRRQRKWPVAGPILKTTFLTKKRCIGLVHPSSEAHPLACCRHTAHRQYLLCRLPVNPLRLHWAAFQARDLWPDAIHAPRNYRVCLSKGDPRAEWSRRKVGTHVCNHTGLRRWLSMISM
jgi:hypothetical protein